jgi:nucleoside-diphosphate-sugar epimerase
MVVLILGIDGYLGFSLAQRLLAEKHDVWGLDNLWRRNQVTSIVPIQSFKEREQALKEISQKTLFIQGHASNLRFMVDAFACNPDVIVHLAQMPSAPYSMRSYNLATETQVDNITTTLCILWLMKDICPKAHLIKLGSMGEYGTPDKIIIEGNMSFQPWSFYHASKCFDSINIEMACRLWGLKATDINQGIVYGLNNDKYVTRFDADQIFGTVINRFCIQALRRQPLTVYGKGGQTRSFLPLQDSMDCLSLVINNPPEQGEYRVFNQFAEIYSINQIADMFQEIIDCKVSHIDNPRIEKEDHRYIAVNDKLKALGYKPRSIKTELSKLVNRLGNIL